jgi:hypothetical protein
MISTDPEYAARPHQPLLVLVIKEKEAKDGSVVSVI